MIFTVVLFRLKFNISSFYSTSPGHYVAWGTLYWFVTEFSPIFFLMSVHSKNFSQELKDIEANEDSDMNHHSYYPQDIDQSNANLSSPTSRSPAKSKIFTTNLS
jgi:hypothetical protein